MCVDRDDVFRLNPLRDQIVGKLITASIQFTDSPICYPNRQPPDRSGARSACLANSCVDRSFPGIVE